MAKALTVNAISTKARREYWGLWLGTSRRGRQVIWKWKNNEDASMYKLIRKDSACVQMVTHIKERHLQCCYTSGGVHPLVGIFEEIVKDKKR